MTRLKTTIIWARTHAGWLAIAALPLVLAACNNGGSGAEY
jgi:hypothetical protein